MSTSTDRPILLILLVACLLAVIFAAGSYWLTHRPSTPAYSCNNPPPGSLCANDQWYAGWMEFQALNAEVQRDQQSSVVEAIQQKQDRALGIKTRLVQMIPPGYVWDPKKGEHGVFVPAPAQPAPTAPAAPAAPPAK